LSLITSPFFLPAQPVRIILPISEMMSRLHNIWFYTLHKDLRYLVEKIQLDFCPLLEQSTALIHQSGDYGYMFTLHITWSILKHILSAINNKITKSRFLTQETRLQ
jgi:hypothetical protein